ncbi:MAG: rRNA maturation RNase YbeY [Oscillospiraceae bacterium]|nr:rRNA maturation RNase YbeY [Oscillospiraceae bacterium]
MHEVIVNREKPNLRHPQSARLIREAVEQALACEKIRENCTVSVLLTDDEGIRAINKSFRDVDSVTDVLSFPMNELTPGDFRADACEKDPETGNILLGDILLNLKRCEEQGEEYGHGFSREIRYLTVHSVLHLLGYDHMDEGAQKKLMRSREKAIMGEKADD